MYGNLTGYEPTETPGAYRFVHKDGRKVFAAGPEAEALKRKLDQANAVMPKPTADASDYIGFSPADLVRDKPRAASDAGGPLMSVAPPEPAPAPAPAPAAATSTDANASMPPEAAMSTQPAPVASIGKPALPGPAPAGPQYVAVARNNDGSIVEMRVGADPNNPMPGDVRVFRPGSRGSRGGLALRAQTVAGGYEQDPEFLAEQAKIQAAREAANLMGAQAADTVGAAEAGFERRKLELDTNAETEARNRSAGILARVQELDDRHTKLEKDFTSARVDPGRMFAGGKNWAYGLAAGLATFGAGLSKTPNVAVQVLQQRVADDIKAQEAEVAVKRDAADNAYKRLLQETGSSELAKKSLESIQLRKLISEFEVQARPGKDKARQANALAMLASLKEAYANAEEARRIAAMGEVTKQFVNTPGSAGRAAGYALPTMGDIQGVKGVLAPQVQPKEGEGKAEPPKKSAEMQRYEAQVDAFNTSLADFVEAHGGRIDPETGDIVHPETGEPLSDLDLPTDLPGGDTDATSAAKSDVVKLGTVYANMNNAGAEAGQPSKEAATPNLGMTGAPFGQIKAMAREGALRAQKIRQQNEAQQQGQGGAQK